MINFLTATLLCTGTAPTTPVTNIEVEIRPETYSTISYEYAEGPYQGTSFIQSIGIMKAVLRKGSVYYSNGEGVGRATLVLKTKSDKIESASFTHLSSNSKDTTLECMVEE